MIEAINRVHLVISGISVEEFEENWEKRWLVERGIEVISEASRHLPDVLKDRQPQIPWSKVAGIGNVIRRAYDHVAADILWQLVRNDLPLLKSVCADELEIALAIETSQDHTSRKAAVISR